MCVGPGQYYSSIQSAIDASSDGDTIYVYGGDYREALVIDKQLTLIGLRNSSGGRPLMLAWPDSESQGASAAMNISAGGTIIDGFEFKSDCNDSYYSNYSTGILIHTNDGYMDGSGPDIQSHGPHTASGCEIRNVSITDCCTGIRIDFASKTTVTDSVFTRNYIGVDLSWGRGTVVCKNEFIDSYYSGMALDKFSPNCVIVQNNFIGYKHRPIRMVYAVGNVSANTSSPESYTYQSQPYHNCTGNYWSEYHGVDGNGDGIGDSPYLIDVGGSGLPYGGTYNFTDNYPAMGRWSFDSGTASIGNPTVVPADSADIPLSVRLHTLHVGEGQIYSTIQRAINVSADGDTIYVHGGVYPEAVVVDKQLTLIGVPNSSGSKPLLTGWPAPSAIEDNPAMDVTSRGVTIDGFDFMGNQNSTGIRITGNDCILRNITVSSCWTGIEFGAGNATVTHSVFSDNVQGATAHYASNLTIARNDFIDNKMVAFLDFTSYTTFFQNNFINNSAGVRTSITNNVRVNSTLPVSYSFCGSIFTNRTGNFWSNNTAVDDNHDGIADTPYVSSVLSDFGWSWNFTDDYPAIGEWSFDNGTATIRETVVNQSAPTAQSSIPVATPSESGYSILLAPIALLLMVFIYSLASSRRRL